MFLISTTIKNSIGTILSHALSKLEDYLHSVISILAYAYPNAYATNFHTEFSVVSEEKKQILD